MPTRSRPFIVGNWKMHGLIGDVGHANAIFAHASTLPDIDVALCVPATLLMQCTGRFGPERIGAQDCHMAQSGAFTGSISAAMLCDCGASLTIIGHSERREGCGETNAIVKEKAQAALDAGLGIILCVGESHETRLSGAAIAFVLEQIAQSLPAISTRALENNHLTIAYEPIWAIGTGLVPQSADIAAMHAAIHGALCNRFGADADHIRLLYGGSVNGGNAADILSIAHVDGALVGGASLTHAKFAPILDAAATLAKKA